MSVRPISEVRQRAVTDPFFSRSLGFFTDSTMAVQVIFACYREAWKELMSDAFLPSVWFSSGLRNSVAAQGFDTWEVNERNSAAPLFYSVPAQLWNQVPSNIGSAFTFTMEGADFLI